MTVLPDVDRIKIWRGMMRFWSVLHETIFNLSKADLRAAVDATDTWIDSNQVSYNSALPIAARTNLTFTQKTVLLCAVAAMRVGTDYLRGLLGQEVD